MSSACWPLKYALAKSHTDDSCGSVTLSSSLHDSTASHQERLPDCCDIISPNSMPNSSTVPNLLLIGAGGAAAAVAVCCWTMFGRLASSTSGMPSTPLETRKQKLAEAEQKFGSMFAKVRTPASLAPSTVTTDVFICPCPCVYLCCYVRTKIIHR